MRVYQEGGHINNVSRNPVIIDGIISKYQTTKTNLVAHSLGGVVSRYYINKTQGANVKQLTTLGTPHKGALVATAVQYTILDPITDPLGWRKIWRIRFSGILFSGISLDREPNMIYELKPTSEFITNLNISIPNISRYYCIGGVIGLGPVLFYTDGFIELVSALAENRNLLPLALPNESELTSLFPNYKGRILVPSWWDIISKETNHLALPEKWEEILKAIDPAGRVEITEPKDGFSPPEEGELIVKGRVYDEYLPADCKLELRVLLEGEMEERIIDNPNPVSGEPAWVWRLQPTDLWRADDPNSPVAEFEIRIPEEYTRKVEKVKVTISNPGGYTYEDKVSWNLLIVDEGTKEVYCLDGPITIRANYPKIVNEFRLVDEEGNEIESRPLGVAWDDTLGIFYVSFDDKKIRAYNEYGELVKTNSGIGYLEVPEMPDGLVNPFPFFHYLNVWGRYVSEVINGFGYIDYFNERVTLTNEIFLNIPPEKYGDPWNWTKVNPTDGVWEYHSHLTPLLVTWYSSKDLGLVRIFGGGSGHGGYMTADNVPLGFSPTGLVQRGAYFYLVSLDGRLYKKYCKNAEKWVTVDWRKWGGQEYEGKYSVDSYSVLDSDYLSSILKSRGYVRYDISNLPEEFYSVKIPMFIRRTSASYSSVNVNLDVTENWDYDNISWNNQPEALRPLAYLFFPPFYIQSYEEAVVDVTDAVRERLMLGEETLDIRCKTDEEGEYINRAVRVWLGPMYVEETTWAIDLSSEAPSDLGLGRKLRMRIKPGYPTSVNVGDIIQLKAHGKEPLVWQSSDEDVGKVDSNGLFTAVGKGTCTVTVTDALGNTAVSEDISVQ